MTKQLEEKFVQDGLKSLERISRPATRYERITGYIILKLDAAVRAVRRWLKS